ncbi:MAG: hypothetical protein H9534_00035 [Dolichospermum circinale Clear-D4]|nr:hypothetical protein [Dolichospermum circinale Clear-D4]
MFSKDGRTLVFSSVINSSSASS